MEVKYPPSKIDLVYITLKKRNTQQAYAGFECVNSDRDRLREFLPWVDATKSVDDQIWYINECLQDWDRGTLFDYAIFTKENEYAGSIGVHSIQWAHNCCELGYWLHSHYEGKGYISEAVQGLEKVLFEMGFNRIEIRCDPNNKKSAAVPLRNGYQFEGVLRQEKLFRDNYRDTAVYAKLKADLKREMHRR